MAAGPSIDLSGWLEEQLVQASPDLLRGMIKTFAEALMSAEADAICGAGYGERSEERVTKRNGYRDRDWDTRAGTVELAIPKLRTLVLSARLDRYYDRLRLPAGRRPLPGSPPVIGRHAPMSFRSHRASEGLSSSRRHLPNVRALYAGEFLTAALQDLHRFHGLRPEGRGLGSPFPR